MRTASVITGGIVGNIIEWYNFMIYGFLANQISSLFFPTDDLTISIILTYSLFAIGFLARPVGAIIFGYIGDHYGRQRSLVLALIFMLIPTAVITCLPSYATAGILSPVLLLICRILQGLSIGGEYTGSAIYMSEIAPKLRKSLWISLVPATTAIGLMLGSATAWFTVSYFAHQTIIDWAWRLPFALGTFICLIGVIMRIKLPESPEFESLTDTKQPLFKSLIRKDTRLKFIILCGVITCYGVFYQVLYIWLPGFLQFQLGRPAQWALAMNTISMILFIILVMVFGFIGDYCSNRKMTTLASLLLLVLSYPFMSILNADTQTWLLDTAIFVMTTIFALYVASITKMAVNLFSVANRFTGLSLGYNLAFAIFGGTTPLIFTWLIRIFHHLHAPAYYLMACALLALLMIKIDKNKNQTSN